MPWKERKNGGWVADYLTEGEAAQFWREHKNIGAGISARMMKAGGGKVTVHLSAKDQQAPQQQAQTQASNPAGSRSLERLPEKSTRKRATRSGNAKKKRDELWRPGFG